MDGEPKAHALLRFHSMKRKKRKSTKPQSSATGQPPESPVESSGKPQEPTAQPVVVQVPSVQVSLVAITPRGPTMAEAIHNSLSNPQTVISLSFSSRQHSDDDPSSDVPWPDTFLSGFKQQLDGGFLVLNLLAVNLHANAHGQVSFDRRVRARVILSELQRWTILSVLRRQSVQYAEQPWPMKIDAHIHNLTSELAAIGHELAMVWIELQTMKPWPEPELEPSAAVREIISDLDRIPELDAPGAEWLPVGKAATHELVKVAVLSNYRVLGKKSGDGLKGIDTDGRMWRKQRPEAHAHTVYLESTLRRISKK
jgi:hypothetical protein